MYEAFFKDTNYDKFSKLPSHSLVDSKSNVPKSHVRRLGTPLVQNDFFYIVGSIIAKNSWRD